MKERERTCCVPYHLYSVNSVDGPEVVEVVDDDDGVSQLNDLRKYDFRSKATFLHSFPMRRFALCFEHFDNPFLGKNMLLNTGIISKKMAEDYRQQLKYRFFGSGCRSSGGTTTRPVRAASAATAPGTCKPGQ